MGEHAISPKPLLDRLGVKLGMRVLLVDVDDDVFRSEVAGRAAVVGARAAACDLIFLWAPHRRSLRRIAALRRRLTPAGALWVLRPKGSADISEMDVLDAGRAAGLYDTKVVAFSAASTAEKFVIPVASRGSRGSSSPPEWGGGGEAANPPGPLDAPAGSEQRKRVADRAL